MKRLMAIVAFLSFIIVKAQPPQAELSRTGFPAVDVSIPATPNEKLVDLTKNWALETYKRGNFDVSEVTDNTVTISAVERRAFFYRNKGEGFDHDIRFDMKITFSGNRYTVNFIIKQIFADGVRIEYNIPDYFTSDGKLKEDYEEVKPSLEATVNKIIRSHYNFILNFR
jgi:hypothetical protein